mmetsp:Transcript_27541/g.59774  ORF Transcript_27541/g.59774 Transcript_27541/m.59774 type:complete len:372 (-) Transcript_27541:250-1365(-)
MFDVLFVKQPATVHPAQQVVAHSGPIVEVGETRRAMDTTRRTTPGHPFRTFQSVCGYDHPLCHLGRPVQHASHRFHNRTHNAASHPLDKARHSLLSRALVRRHEHPRHCFIQPSPHPLRAHHKTLSDVAGGGGAELLSVSKIMRIHAERCNAFAERGGDLGGGVEDAMHRVAHETQRPFGQASLELCGGLDGALCRFIEEVRHPRGEVGEQADGVAQELDAADDLVKLGDGLVLVMLGHGADEGGLRGEDVLHDAGVEVHGGAVDVGHDQTKHSQETTELIVCVFDIEVGDLLKRHVDGNRVQQQQVHTDLTDSPSRRRELVVVRQRAARTLVLFQLYRVCERLDGRGEATGGAIHGGQDLFISLQGHGLQ